MVGSIFSSISTTVTLAPRRRLSLKTIRLRVRLPSPAEVRSSLTQLASGLRRLRLEHDPRLQQALFARAEKLRTAQQQVGESVVEQLAIPEARVVTLLKRDQLERHGGGRIIAKSDLLPERTAAAQQLLRQQYAARRSRPNAEQNGLPRKPT